MCSVRGQPTSSRVPARHGSLSLVVGIRLCSQGDLHIRYSFQPSKVAEQPGPERAKQPDSPRCGAAPPSSMPAEPADEQADAPNGEATAAPPPAAPATSAAAAAALSPPPLKLDADAKQLGSTDLEHKGSMYKAEEAARRRVTLRVDVSGGGLGSCHVLGFAQLIQVRRLSPCASVARECGL